MSKHFLLILVTQGVRVALLNPETAAFFSVAVSTFHTVNRFFISPLQSHPGTNVTVIDLFDRSASLEPMWKQVEGFKAAIYPIMQNAADGVHFICYSQGP